MAAANFFDRALLSASQALRGIPPGAIQERLEASVVEIAFDRQAATAIEGRFSLDLAVRLLSRFYPSLLITDLSNKASPLAKELESLALAINPRIDLAPITPTSVRLIFGTTAGERGPTTIYAGSDGWLAKISAVEPQGSSSSAISFGAGGAACLGAANIFRAIFSDALQVPRLDESAVLSFVDFSAGKDAPQGPLMFSANIGTTRFVGLGAIGNGAIWGLSRTKGLLGTLHLVDHEAVELSNLQRYILTTQQDVGQAKVDVAERALAAEAFQAGVELFDCRWDEYLARQGHPPMERVVVALDSAEDRIAVQASLPRRVLNAWTQAGDLGVSRHGFLGSEACLACLYLPSGSKPNEDQVIAEALKLPTQPQEVLHSLRELLVNGQPVGEQFVRDAAQRLGLPDDALNGFAGEPLRQFYVKAVCGGAILDGQPGRPPLEAPLAFQSALAGIMLAADLVADAGGLRSGSIKTKTVLDVTRPLPKQLNFQIAKRAESAASKCSKCICQDPDFIAAYQTKHVPTAAE